MPTANQLEKRRVSVTFEHGNWFVRYLDRRPGQRHCAAGFYGPDHTEQWVKDWVIANPKLELVEAEKGIGD